MWNLKNNPGPGIKPMSPTSPAFTGGFFTTAPPGKSLIFIDIFIYICIIYKCMYTDIFLFKFHSYIYVHSHTTQIYVCVCVCVCVCVFRKRGGKSTSSPNFLWCLQESSPCISVLEQVSALGERT